jgi:hypothetical protein
LVKLNRLYNIFRWIASIKIKGVDMGGSFMALSSYYT